MRQTIKSLTLEISNLKAEAEQATKWQAEKDRLCVIEASRVIQAQHLEGLELVTIMAMLAAEVNDLRDRLSHVEGEKEQNPLHLLWETLSITEPTNYLWNELVVRIVDKGFNVYFPKSYYDTDKDNCKAFLGKLMRHSHAQHKKAWFAPDYLAIRNG